MTYKKQEPLAYRMSPVSLEDYVGQAHILSEGKMLRRMIETDQLQSIILFGPPGTGKTSLARIIAETTTSTFRKINAVTSGVKDIKAIIEDTHNYLLTPSGRTVLFIDEIHRFNKAQQDALLPSVEDGSLILIGATTENPYFEVNKALLSRSSVFQLYPLTKEDIETLIIRALEDPERGYGNEKIRIEEDALDFLADMANGDARSALNALELAHNSTPWSKDPETGEDFLHLTLEVISECIQRKPIRYDKNGEDHYDVISAFIKSVRGSAVDAALLYLAKMLEAGEDPNFIARRLVILASEDVGMANPQALSIAVSAWLAVERVGMPEGRIILGQATVMLATSPKSNKSYLAVDQALADVRSKDTGEVPLALRNAVMQGMGDNLGYGQGYRYAHDYPHSIAPMEFMPDKMRGVRYYEPTENGYEKTVKSWLENINSILKSDQ